MSGTPNDHDKWMRAAYLRVLGATQGEAAEAVSVTERTIRRWEADPGWAEVRREAVERWACEVDDAARRRVLQAIRDEEDTATARWWLERTDPSLQRDESPLNQVLQIFRELPTEELHEAREKGRLHELLQERGVHLDAD